VDQIVVDRRKFEKLAGSWFSMADFLLHLAAG
jgi:hypothetical protein